MNAASLVKDASDKTQWLIHKEYKGIGDTKAAIGRVADRIGVPYGTIWKLRYKEQCDILASVYFAINDAYDREVERQARLSRNEHQITKARTWAGRALLRAAAALDGEDASSIEESRR